MPPAALHALTASPADFPRPLQHPPTSHTAGADQSRQVPASTPVDVLLRRMQAGDRAAAAEFLLRFEKRIRRRVRGKLAADVRRLFDTLDIFSTLGRRFDGYVLSGRLRAENEFECLNLLLKMADNALIDKSRLVLHLELTEGEDSEFAHLMAGRLRNTDRHKKSDIQNEIERCMAALPDPIDRRILSLWLTGEQHKDIAMILQMSAELVRRRWHTIKHTLRERLDRDSSHKLEHGP